MTLRGKMLALSTSFAGSVEQLAAEPRPKPRVEVPQGSRLAYVSVSGVLDPDYMYQIRRQIDLLTADVNVREIVIYANSPGGTVEGAPELAEMVRRAAAVKPVHVIAEGYLASGAYWAFCQATTIYVAPSTLSGSIGVMFALVDDSEFFGRLGIKVLIISSGKNKGAGIPGVKVEDDTIAMLRRIVDAHTSDFQVAIMKGRKLSAKAVLELSDGSVWVAAQAKALGLVDGIALPEDRFAELQRKTPPELFTDLRGQAAFDKVLELAGVSEADDDDFDDDSFIDALADIPQAKLAAVRRDHPRLVCAVEEYESQRFYRTT